MVKKLTASNVRAARPTGERQTWRDTLVRGLELRIAVSGAKSWSYRYRIGRRSQRLTLGKYPDLSLADARNNAKEAGKKVSKGIDPAHEKRERREADTFGDLAHEFIEKHSKPRKRSWKADDRILKKEVLPFWKNRLATDISRRDVRELLEALVAREVPTLANRVHALLSKLFKFGIEREVVTVSPVFGLSKPAKESQRDRVLTDDELRKLWKRCEELEPAMAGLFRLRLVTAQRGGEVMSMKWSDVDLDGAWWTIPAEDSKNGLAHRVPLNPAAVRILTAIRKTVDDERSRREKEDKPWKEPVFVLAGARGKRQQAAASATFGIEDFVGHDLRRTAASRMASAGVPRLVVAKILNHAETGVTRIYDRHSYDPEKVVAMQTWDRELKRVLSKRRRSNVTPIRRRA